MLTPQDFQSDMNDGVVIDTRSPEAFAGAHIQGSYNIWLEGLSTFGGWIASERTDIFLIVGEPEKAPAAIVSLARVGIDTVRGVLAKGVDAWREEGLPIESLATTSAEETAQWLQKESIYLLDVRDDMEWNEKHIPGANHTFVGYLAQNLPQVPKEQRIVVHCSVGHRSGLAVSILQRQGFTNVHNMLGGLSAWDKLGLPLDRSKNK